MSGKIDKIPPRSGTPSRYRVEVRLSAEERSHLEALAQNAGMSLSHYVRYACFDRALPPVVTDIAVETYQELGKIGDELAQLKTETNPELLNELLMLLHQIRGEIAGVRSTESGLYAQLSLKLSNHP